MNKTISMMLMFILILSLICVTGCSGGKTSTSPVQTTGQTPKTSTSPSQTTGQTPKTSTSPAQTTSQTPNTPTPERPPSLRNENWLIGTWSATVPKTDSSNFAGKKINLYIASVKLESKDEIKGRSTGKYAYSGNLVWDTDGEKKTIGFGTADQLTGDSILIWSYASPDANQYMENISMRVYDMTYSLELDWGPQISKPGSTIKSLEFYGSIQNLDTSDRDNFDPKNMIKFTQTSSTAPTIALIKPTTTSAGSSPTKTTTPTKTSSPPKTTSTGSGTRDIWSDVPIYTNAKAAEDEGFSLSVGGDPSYSQIEWHFYASTDAYTKVVDFYTKQMPAKGWTKMMWVNVGEMAYGTFQKNNEDRLCMVYVIKTEGGAGINIQSAAK
jgi:hypothetical protein